MTRTTNIDQEYRCNASKAIEKFFNKYPEHDEWKDQFEWMNENSVEHFMDDMMADGTKNENWGYSLWLVKEEKYTYIAIVERSWMG